MESCGFGNILNDECHKICFVQKQGLKKFCNLEKDFQDTYIWRSGLLKTTSYKEIKTICYHYEQVLGPIFLLKNDKCCDVLKRHKKKVKGNIYIYGQFHSSVTHHAERFF